MAVAQWTLTQVIQQLNGGARWTSSIITYAFPGTASGLYSAGEAQGFRPANAAQQALITLALQTWDELIPQTMQAGTPGSTSIEFAYTNTNIGFAHAYFPQNGSAWFNSSETDLTQPVLGEYGFLTFVHEIGHALGLNHMGDYNGNGNWTPSSYQDSIVLSVMSYFGPRNAAAQYSAEVAQADWVDARGNTHDPQTPMVNDVAAIQSIYGTSTTTRTGDTVYGFHANVDGSTAQILNFDRNPNPIVTIFDSAGTDTLDLSGWSTPSRIDLHAGAYSSANAMSNNIAIAFSALIENAIGGGGADVLVGNQIANRLEGGGGDDEIYGNEGDDLLVPGAGNDLLDGGAGNDTALFSFTFTSYTITVNGGTVTLSGTGGSVRASGIERFQFSDVTRLLAELSSVDTAAPQLAALSPADNAGNVSGNSNLVLSFNEAVKAGSGAITVFTAAGAPVLQTTATDVAIVRIDGTQVVIDPPQLLAVGAYYVQLAPGSLSDLAGNAFAGITGTTAWNFSVVATDNAPPVLLSISPADEATAVTPSANLVLVFDENIQSGSGSIVIRDANGGLVRSFAAADSSQVLISGATVTINPLSDLPAASRLTVTVEAGALRDVAGNAFGGLVASTAWNFSTAIQTGDDYAATSITSGFVAVGGAPSNGVIETVNDQDAFKVVLAAGSTYTFTLQRVSGGLVDPLLGLYGPNEALLTTDDDSAGNGNSRIVYTARTSGTHYLIATDYGSGTGGYQLSAAVLDTTAPTLVGRTPADDAANVSGAANLVLNFSEPVFAGGGAIRLLTANGTLLGTIAANDAQQVSVSGSTVTINPTADLLPGSAYVVNIDPSAFRDAAGNGYAGISGLSAWNFATAARVNNNDDYPMSTSTTGVVLPGGPALVARIDTPEDGDLFRINLSAGVTYQFEMNAPLSSAVDPYLMLYGLQPDIDLLGFDDDGGGNFNALLYFTPDKSGTYFLAAFDYADATGSYSVSASVPSDDFLGSTNSNGRLIVGAPGAVGRIGVPGDIDTFAVTLAAGQSYSFDLTWQGGSGLEDPYLVLLGTDGQAVAYDDDGGANFNSRINFSAPAAGTYYLSASDFDAGTGVYLLSGLRLNVVLGGSGNDNLAGTAVADRLVGGNGNDLLNGGNDNDVLEGGAGIDTAVLRGAGAQFEIEAIDQGWVLHDTVGNEGIDDLVGVERLRFADMDWALDLDGNAGVTVKILGAVFGPASVANEAYVGIGLAYLDNGVSSSSLLQLALDFRLGPHPSNAAVVNLLYQNLLGVAPGAADFNYFTGLLNSGQMTQLSLASLAVEHELNLLNIDFTGLSEIGLPFIPYTG